jgi:hypothetical protein
MQQPQVGKNLIVVVNVLLLLNSYSGMPTLNYKTATDSFCQATQKDRTITVLLPTGVG